MATTEMNCLASGGGSPTSIGTFEAISGQITTVSCGFEPKYIGIVFNGSGVSSQSVGSGAVRMIYDADLNNGYCYRGLMGGSNTPYVQTNAIGTTGGSDITEITSDGFKFYIANASIYAGTYYYFAIG